MSFSWSLLSKYRNRPPIISTPRTGDQPGGPQFLVILPDGSKSMSTISEAELQRIRGDRASCVFG
jgi:hypothetical protein